MAQKQHGRLGEGIWSRMPRVSGEIFALTYGALVMQVVSFFWLLPLFFISFAYQLIKDYEEPEAVNAQLEKLYVVSMLGIMPNFLVEVITLVFG